MNIKVYTMVVFIGLFVPLSATLTTVSRSRCDPLQAVYSLPNFIVDYFMHILLFSLFWPCSKKLTDASAVSTRTITFDFDFFRTRFERGLSVFIR